MGMKMSNPSENGCRRFDHLATGQLFARARQCNAEADTNGRIEFP